MSERVTLRAKSDGTELPAELVGQDDVRFIARLATNVPANFFSRGDWEIIHPIPTAPGAVFRATVRGVPDMRVMVSLMTSPSGDMPPTAIPYVSATRAGGLLRHGADDIDPATVVIELEA